MEIAFYTKPGCHLCDRLERLIAPALRDLQASRDDVTFVKRDINDAAEWHEAYWDRIPVVTADGRVVLEGNPDEQTVRETMAAL